MKAQEADLTRIENKLDTIIRLVALSVAPDNQSLKERAVLLKRAGFTPKEIASLCDTTSNAVSVALSRTKRTNPGSS